MHTALVTGTSSGIGRAVALTLIAGGWTVIGLDRADATIEHKAFTALSVDLADVSALTAIMSRLANPVHAFVHAAGVMRGNPLGRLDAADGNMMWLIHVAAAETIGNHIVPTMPDGGRIVLIGSRAARGIALKSQYGATKAALVALARAWGRELAPRRIAVNVVAPAAVDTPMLADPARADVPPAALPPMGRLVSAEEVAGLVAYLLSPAAQMITGQEIGICGGASL